MSTEQPNVLLTQRTQSILHDSRLALATRVGLGDALLYLYIAIFLRQYLWVIHSNVLAWILTVPLAAIGWYLYISTKPIPAERSRRSFWLLVALPLLAIYALRAAFPDHSFDVLSYHLFEGERSIRGTLFITGDFFPIAAPFNPAPDMLTAISRKVLGYRLGTVINWLALVWAAQITEKILRPFVTCAWLRSACVLVVFLAEHLLFEVSTYMVDLLTLPLLLEATYLTLLANEDKNTRGNIYHISFLLGASAAFKITNLAVALPLLMLWAFKTWQHHTFAKQLKTAALASLVFLLPLLPFSIYMYRLTGNPLFPIGNVVFKSPYWPTHGGWDNRWGPTGFWQTIFWPLLAVFHPERHSELAVYSGRLAIGVIAATFGIFLLRKETYVRQLCLLLLGSCLLWSVAAIGYGRYGLYDELLAGLLVVVVVALLLRDRAHRTWTRIPASLFLLALLAQVALACGYVLHHEWGGRPTFFEKPSPYLREARMFLRDRSLPEFLTQEQRNTLAAVPVWVESSVKSTGIEALLDHKLAIISINHPEYFFTRESRRQFIETVERLSSPQMFSLCLAEEVPGAKQAATLRGLEVGSITPMDIPFFSNRDRIGMMLIEFRRPEEAEARSTFVTSWMNAAFPDSDYREQISALNAPASMRAGEKLVLRFRVKNLGYSAWPAIGNKEGRFQVNIGNRWIKTTSKEVNELDGRTGMPADLQPGNEVELSLTVKAPEEPGDYILEIDMVHEGVTWFFERGATPLHLTVRVER
ncbi:MAG: NBR1-Ig-like domain-containing protein [Pyrinomonadaceae bacterium]